MRQQRGSREGAGRVQGDQGGRAVREEARRVQGGSKQGGSKEGAGEGGVQGGRRERAVRVPHLMSHWGWGNKGARRVQRRIKEGSKSEQGARREGSRWQQEGRREGSRRTQGKRCSTRGRQQHVCGVSTNAVYRPQL